MEGKHFSMGIGHGGTGKLGSRRVSVPEHWTKELSIWSIGNQTCFSGSNFYLIKSFFYVLYDPLDPLPLSGADQIPINQPISTDQNNQISSVYMD